jgi:HAD superfamily hydrolase (TIGR01490 family)
MSSIGAFFDLDRTLIHVNSGLLWARYEFRLGNISRSMMARAVFWSALYHLSLVDIETAFGTAARHYRGTRQADLVDRTRKWFYDEVAHCLRPGAARAIESHRAQGHPLVLLTNSTSFEASVAAETWRLDDYLANRFPVDDQERLVGSYASPLCYGPGKVELAERWAADQDVDLDRSFFYTDSYSDLPMLERVGQPRVVAPDPRLRVAALRRGWMVVDWS